MSERFVYLFASPLVTNTQHGHVSSVRPIPVDGEITELSHVVLRSGVPGLRFVGHHATASRLLSVMTLGFKVLHISAFGTADVLYFEDPFGRVHPITWEQLGEMIVTASCCSHDPHLVVVHSNVAEAVGRVFAAAGVPHVLCLNAHPQSSWDPFLTKYYDALLSGNSVAASFATAQADTSSDHPEKTSQVALLPEDRDHSDALFLEAPRDANQEQQQQQHGLLHCESSDVVSVVDFECDSPVSSFVGRASEAQNVYELLVRQSPGDSSPWITLTGDPGIGKTQLALYVCAYARQRRKFAHIFFVDGADQLAKLDQLRASIDPDTILPAYITNDDFVCMHLISMFARALKLHNVVRQVLRRVGALFNVRMDAFRRLSPHSSGEKGPSGVVHGNTSDDNEMVQAVSWYSTILVAGVDARALRGELVKQAVEFFRTAYQSKGRSLLFLDGAEHLIEQSTQFCKFLALFVVRVTKVAIMVTAERSLSGYGKVEAHSLSEVVIHLNPFHERDAAELFVKCCEAVQEAHPRSGDGHGTRARETNLCNPALLACNGNPKVVCALALRLAHGNVWIDDEDHVVELAHSVVPELHQKLLDDAKRRREASLEASFSQLFFHPSFKVAMEAFEHAAKQTKSAASRLTHQQLVKGATFWASCHREAHRRPESDRGQTVTSNDGFHTVHWPLFWSQVVAKPNQLFHEIPHRVNMVQEMQQFLLHSAVSPMGPGEIKNGTFQVSVERFASITWPWLQIAEATVDVMGGPGLLGHPAGPESFLLCGIISGVESMKRLRQVNQGGCFLVRLSESKPGALSLDYLAGPNQMRKSLVQVNQVDGRLSLKVGSEVNEYSDLISLIRDVNVLQYFLPRVPKQEVVN